MKTGKRTDDLEQAHKTTGEICKILDYSEVDGTSNQELKDYSREQLISALEILNRDLDHLNYTYSYEEGYWGNFVVNLLIDNKITFTEFSHSMPWAGSQGIDLVIEKFKSRLKSKHLNLTKEELADAFFYAKFPLKPHDPYVTHPANSVTKKQQLAELERVLELSYKDIENEKPINILDELRKKTAK